MSLSLTIQTYQPNYNYRISSVVRSPPPQHTPACDTSPAHHVHWAVVLVQLELAVMAHPVHLPVQLVPERGEPGSSQIWVSQDSCQREECSELHWCE